MPGDFLLNVMLEAPVTADQEVGAMDAAEHALAVYAAGSKLESPEETATVTARVIPVASAKHALSADLMV